MGKDARTLPKPKPPKTAYSTGDESKPWSPTMSSPDFQQLMKLEEEKLKSEGYMRNSPRVLSPNKSLSMPSLNDVDGLQAVTPFEQKQSRIQSNGKALSIYF